VLTVTAFHQLTVFYYPLELKKGKPMKRPTPFLMPHSERLVVPVWADRIEPWTSEDPASIAVRATKPWEFVTSRTLLDTPPTDFLTGCSAAEEPSKTLDQDLDVPVPVNTFLNAQSPEELEQFVFRFGPVFAHEIKSLDNTGKPAAIWQERSVIAYQNRAALLYEQKIFRHLWDLCNALKKLDAWASAGGIKACCDFYAKYKDSDLDLESIRSQWRHFLFKYRFPDDPPDADVEAVKRGLERLFEIFEEYGFRAERDPDNAILGKLYTFWERVDEWSTDYLAMTNDPRRLPPFHAVHYRVGKRLLADVMNLFQTKLTWIDFRIENEPSPERSGIRSLLYYVLRRNFEGMYEYRLCRTAGCNQWFTGPPNKEHHDLNCKKKDGERGRRARAKLARTTV
jgi:hypothetical protein